MSEIEHSYEKFFHRLLLIALAAAIGLREWAALEHGIAALNITGVWLELVRHSIEFGLPLTCVAAVSAAYRRSLWKWLHPEMNFGGRWIGVSTYGDSVMPLADPSIGFIENVVSGVDIPPLITVIEFCQDMTSTTLRNGRSIFPSDSRATWFSTSLNIEHGDPMKICMSYEVQNPPDAVVSAMERMIIYPSRRQPTRTERITRKHRYPQTMKGEFGHSWNGLERILHHGYCYYARVTESELDALESLARNSTRDERGVIALINGVESLRHEDMGAHIKSILVASLRQPTSSGGADESRVGAPSV